MPEYHRPTNLIEALDIRSSCDVTVLAGGTDVYPAKVSRAAWGDPSHKAVLDISAVPGLRSIREHWNHWHIGALTTWTDVIRADLPAMFDGFKLAAREVGGVQIQNRGTLVGNICTASPAGDGIPCLLALDASVVLASPGRVRRLPLAEFNLGYRQTACAADELVTGLMIPKLGDQACSHFLKLGARRYLVISITMVAVVVDINEAGLITAARVAVGSCSAVARRLPVLEAALTWQKLGDAPDVVNAIQFAELAPIDDIRGTGIHRLHAAEVLVRDCLAEMARAESQRAR